ncbi:terpenoid synthase [Rickenella mellea]|uniref:Terpene synthase n=1 Tax=Rickenella mellea TaxID=50990 RepID=A0A4Y7PUH7_9AGAM|nr:terpenoid synthase [Rickenella mellea]
MPVSTKTLRPSASEDSFILPDLVSHCKFPLSISPYSKKVGTTSHSWLVRGGNLSIKKEKANLGLKGGLLTAMTYPDAPRHELRVCCDFLTYLFHLDNISDCMDDEGANRTADVVMNSLYHSRTYHTSSRVGKMTKDIWRRVATTATKGMKQRFISTFDMFFQAVAVQAADRQDNVIPDLESYITLRRDTSGCKPCWALIEYANGLDIPDDVIEHPVLRDLGEAANDLVTWSNDIFSYNVEQSKGDTHNMIVIVMETEGVPLQTAIDFVGTLCKASIDRFNASKLLLPSFDGGNQIDRDVAQYIKGLEDWIVGSLHWSFETERYFGKLGREVKRTRVVKLLPKRHH